MNGQIIFRHPDGRELEVNAPQVLRAAAQLIKEERLRLYFPLPWMRCCSADCKKEHPNMSVDRTVDVAGALLFAAEQLGVQLQREHADGPVQGDQGPQG